MFRQPRRWGGGQARGHPSVPRKRGGGEGGTTHRYSAPGLGDYSGGCTPAVRIASSPSPQLSDPLNHHESGTGGGGTRTPFGSCERPTRPLGSEPAREGVVVLGAQCHLVGAARPRTSIKVSRSWRKCERCRWPWVPVLKWPRETVLRHSRCFSTPPCVSHDSEAGAA